MFDAYSFVFLVGLLPLLRLALDVVLGAYAKFLRPAKNLRSYGSWALVTGATDGIGKAYAFELARQRLNVILVSRTESKLQDVKKELGEKFPAVEVITVAADMGNITPDVRDKLERAVANVDLGVLINNVGISYPYPQYFHELTDAQAQALIDLNVTATSVMTRIALPKMVEKKKGAVVNISSFAGEMPSPLLSGYNGAKAGITAMTDSLHHEYAAKGIHFQTQTPLFVSTKLAKQRPSLTVPTPAAFVRSAAKAIGYESHTSPFWAHAAIQYVITSLPTFLAMKLVMSMHLGLRKRGQAKDAKQKAEAQ